MWQHGYTSNCFGQAFRKVGKEIPWDDKENLVNKMERGNKESE